MRDGWRETTLGAITTEIAKSAPTQDFNYVDISSVSREAKAITAPVRTEASAAPGRARQHLQVDDVLVSTVRPNLNAVARIPRELDGAVGSTGFAVLRASADVDPGILFAVVRSSEFIEAMTERASGSNYPAITDKIVREFPICLPLLHEQRRIADLIAAVDDAVKAAAAEAAAAEQSVSAFLTDRFAPALRGPLTFSDHLELTGRSVSVEPENRYEMVGVLNRGRGLLERGVISGKDTSYPKLNVIGPDTLVYSRLKAFEGAITVTPSDLGEAYASAEFPSFAPLPNTSADWLREITRCPDLWDQLAARSKGMGGRRERLKPADLLTIPLTAPAREVQAEMASTARTLRDVADAARETADALRKLRTNLLTVLLSGEHEIPASYGALLEEETA